MTNHVNTIEKYVHDVIEQHKTGHAREHAYRPAVEKLMKTLQEKTTVVNDPKQSEFGAPDFALVRGNTILGYIEAKDVTADLDKVEKSDQMKRYLGYRNLILTNYLEFRFYQNGEAYGEPIIIAKLSKDTILPNTENFEALANKLSDFFSKTPEPVKSGAHLAKVMGGKARRIRDNAKHFLSTESDKNTELVRVYNTIKKLLVHDLTLETFADMYAQTLVYGLFVARYHDDTPEDFSRQEARDLIPKSNPLLRHFFDHIAGSDFDSRLEHIVNELCEVFSLSNVQELMSQYFKNDLWGKTHEGPDPVIHFYEDFLKEYDADLRKKMGAFYTPLPVVRFIVRSVDYLLEKEFNLSNGLADTTKTKDGVHRVQILDPAVGTGTFISATIRAIYERLLKNKQKGSWPAYVHNDLLPRLHGFELMMAPYTIAHLKLGMAFKETGCSMFSRRLGIYLTNSLEKDSTQKNLFENSFGFAQSIADESKEASVIKNETPIMVVVGNPPYSGESSNAHYTGNDVYKVEPSGGKLQERNSKWLNDDYVKFIRFAESMVEKTGEGIVAMITAHGYIDNPTFRGMRYHLMQTFDQIYILDLHGNTNKKEKSPDGSKDENVFDIKTGVAIFIGIKYKGKKTDKLAKVSRADSFGLRKTKFDYLNTNSLEKIDWKNISPSEPNYEWIIRDNKKQAEYQKGFSVSDLFIENGVGITTAHDNFVIHDKKEELLKKFIDFQLSESDADFLYKKFNVKKKKGWNILDGYKNIKRETDLNKFIQPITYRPFDDRYIFYEDKLVWRTVRKIMNHLLSDNIGLIFARTQKNPVFDAVFVSNNMIETKCGESSTQSAIAPLYIYSEDGSKLPNFKKEIVDEIEKIIGKTLPEDIFDYIYAILYSPNYREKYKEFLKIDFPRVPCPKDKKTFKSLIALGKELRELHLLESPKVNKFITTYPIAGENIVEKPIYKDGKVFINDDQYFGDVPEIAWNFYIGGYQPAQKWLKDRKGRTLTNSDIEHYQKMIVALTETERIMKEIDKIKL